MDYKSEKQQPVFNFRQGPWICDTCGRFINFVGHGMLFWLHDRKSKTGRSLILSHKYENCQPDDRTVLKETGCSVHSVELSRFVYGNDGIMKLIDLMESLPQEEVIEMQKRLFVQGYEEARPFINVAISEKLIEPYDGRSGRIIWNSQIEIINKTQWDEKPDWDGFRQGKIHFYEIQFQLSTEVREKSLNLFNTLELRLPPFGSFRTRNEVTESFSIFIQTQDAQEKWENQLNEIQKELNGQFSFDWTISDEGQ